MQLGSEKRTLRTGSASRPGQKGVRPTSGSHRPRHFDQPEGPLSDLPQHFDHMGSARTPHSIETTPELQLLVELNERLGLSLKALGPGSPSWRAPCWPDGRSQRSGVPGRSGGPCELWKPRSVPCVITDSAPQCQSFWPPEVVHSSLPVSGQPGAVLTGNWSGTAKGDSVRGPEMGVLSAVPVLGASLTAQALARAPLHLLQEAPGTSLKVRLEPTLLQVVSGLW